jgi:hypothetical protein
MDLVLASDSFTDHEVCLINFCCLYLQAITLSDICLADGITLDQSMLRGKPDTNSSTSKWIHVNQARPDKPTWKIWRRACSLWSYQNRLYHPLGDWMPADKLRRQWPIYYDYETSERFVHQTTGYTRCVSTNPIRFSPISVIQWVPTPTSIPVTARLTIQSTDWIAIITHTHLAHPLQPSTSSSLVYSSGNNLFWKTLAWMLTATHFCPSSTHKWMAMWPNS